MKKSQNFICFFNSLLVKTYIEIQQILIYNIIHIFFLAKLNIYSSLVVVNSRLYDDKCYFFP